MSSQDKTAVQPVGGKTADKVFRGVAYACGILILVVLAAVFLFLFFRAWPLIGGDQAANSQTVSSTVLKDLSIVLNYLFRTFEDVFHCLIIKDLCRSDSDQLVYFITELFICQELF